jgi:putative hydrolase of the HAD superfamily
MREPALIFDFGNVVGFFDYQKACNRLGTRMGVAGEVVRERLLASGFPELLEQLESGRIAPPVFAERVLGLCGVSASYEDFVRDWEDIFWLNEPVALLIRRLKSRGYRLVLGSNTNVLHATHYRRQFAATLGLFDHFILSYEVGCLKPASRFYEACVAAAGVPASSCIFVDDLAENVEGARKAGLMALHYVDTPALVADLARVGVEIAQSDC